MFAKDKRLAIFLPCLVILLSICSYFFPEVITDYRYYFLAVAMLTLGIPHGAIDHIISANIYELDFSLSDQMRFYSVYMGLMVFMALVWFINGALGFLIFAAITIYHFGQADVEHISMNTLLKRIIIFSRGIMVFSLILFFDIEFTYPVIASVVDISLLQEGWMMSNGITLGVVLGFQYPILLLSIMIVKQKYTRSWLYLVLDSLLVILLFYANHTIIAFSVYFALWHSYGHILEMKQYLQSVNQRLTISKFYKLAAPFTILSLLGLTVIYLLANAIGMENQMVALLFVLVSVLTLPHVVVVQKMFSRAHHQ